MVPLEKSNFDQTDLAFIELVALDALLNPDMNERRDSSFKLRDMRIIYVPYEEGYKLFSREFLKKEGVKFPIIYSIKKVEIHEGLVVLDLKGRRIKNARLGLCALPERYIQPVDPKAVSPVLI